MHAILAVPMLAAALLLGPAQAAELSTTPDPAMEEGEKLPDPPARAGRLAVIEGAVQTRLPGDDLWQPGLLNLPIGTGSILRSEPAGRALLELPGLTLALDGGGQLEMNRLDDSAVELRLAEGRLGLLVQALRPGDGLVVLTPGGAAVIRKPGRYLVEVGEATGLSVYEGQAEFAGRRVVSGQALLGLEPAPLGPPSPLLAWAASRGPKGDPLPEAVAFMPGAAALARHGTWSRHAEYGDVLRPAVAPGWAPFTQGRWVEVEPWGWSWVDEAPWGFAPSHYGRWYVDAGAWYWAPQPVFLPRLRWPVYAPAVVRFAGWPQGRGRPWGGPVGWAPLAPREAFWGPRRFSPQWQARVNATALPPGVPLGSRPPPGGFARLANAGAAVMAPGAALRSPAPLGPSLQRMNPGFAAPMAGGPLAGPSRWAGIGVARPGSSTPPQAYGSAPAFGMPRGNAPPAYAAPRPYTPPQAYAAPRAYTPPQAYAAPRAYTPPQAYAAPRAYTPPQSYAAPRAYTPPQAYVTPRAYTPPQAYAAPRAYSPPQAYAAPRAYTPPQAYAAPRAYTPPPQAYRAPAPSYSPPPRPAPAAPQRSQGYRR